MMRIIAALVAIHLLASAVWAQRLAQLPWWDRAAERNIGPYWIKSDLSAEAVNALARHLNVMRGEYDKALASVPIRVQEKLRVLIFKDAQECALTLQTRFAVAKAEVGGFYATPADEVLAFWIDGVGRRDVERLIQREGFRQFAFNRFGEDLPVWLEEGLSELFGEAFLIGETLVFGQSSARMCEQLQITVPGGGFIPFDSLRHMTRKEWTQTISAYPAPAYRQVRSMALFAMRDAEAFAKYVRHLNNGLPDEHAFARSFGPDARAFAQGWKQFAISLKPGSLATAVERMEFLAEGALELSRRQMFPQTIDALKTMLRQIGFKSTIRGPLEEYEVSAADEAPFEIPKDALCTTPPTFIINKPRPAASRKEQALNETNPMPPLLATQNLRPAGVQVKWIRHEDNKGFTYEIVLR